MQTPRVVGRIILFIWLMHGLFSYLFTTTPGLAYLDSDSNTGINFVRDLQSSGGNDNISIELGILFAGIAFLWGFCSLRIKTQFTTFDIVIFSLLVGLQTLYLLAIQMGSIIDTVVLGKNIVMALWVFSYISLCAILLAIIGVGIMRKLKGR